MEDGEIVEDVVDLDFGYVPLQRPAELIDPGPRPVQQLPDESEPEEDSSSDDSDSDNDTGDQHRHTKKRKVKAIKPRPLPPTAAAKTKKYDIWCSGLQEEVLTRGLIGCDVAQRPGKRDRNVESYDYLSHRAGYSDSPEDFADDVPRRRSPNFPASNKRSHAERESGNVKSRLGWRTKNATERKGTKRELKDLQVTLDSSIEDFAKDVTEKLNEEKGDLILRIVKVIGKEKAAEIYKLTKSVEANGGMLIMNQTRRRTSGGVFLFHVRNTCNSGECLEIFEDNRREQDKVKRLHRSQKRREIAIAAMAANSQPINHAKVTEAEIEDGELEDGELDMKTEPTSGEEEDPRAIVRNPPPSPVTDCRADSSPESGCVNDSQDRRAIPLKTNNNVPERSLTSYEDDLLDLHVNMEEMDDMETF
ncbi:phosphorylated adapter RNA export protein [Cloeon dipterum]|uniref:phosphorylated adapter RNA export protein n=1 Tax=Cloeon dipterum TaxID=197152 RepID=UPI00321F9FA1